MTNAEFERELASATGETLGEIRRRGFQLVEPDPEPLMVDWDEVYPTEPVRQVLRRQPKRARLAA